MEAFRALLDALSDSKNEGSFLRKYASSFDAIAREVQPESIYESIQGLPNDLFILAPLYVATLYQGRRYQEVYDFLRNLDLSGFDRHVDFYNGRLLKYYYLSMKSLNISIDALYKLLVANREYGNEYSVTILTNSIVEHQIDNNVYLLPEPAAAPTLADSEEGARYSFYLGVIRLVRGEYMDALESFNKADILNKERDFELRLKKHVIVTKLLLSDYSLYYPYSEELRPYFSLIGAVRRAELPSFYEILETFRVEFTSTRLYFVIRRLLSNLLREGLRKISVCYSRIAVGDISRILGVNADYLMHHAIKSKFISGYVRDGVYYGQSQELRREAVFGERIREAVAVSKVISSMMSYPAIEPLTYERVLERERKLNN